MPAMLTPPGNFWTGRPASEAERCGQEGSLRPPAGAGHDEAAVSDRTVTISCPARQRKPRDGPLRGASPPSTGSRRTRAS